MTNAPIPRITPAQQTGLQMALNLRMPEGHLDCGWHRDDQGRPMLMWLGWWCEALGESRSRVQRALSALEKLVPGCLTRRRGDSALVHLDVLDAAVAAAPEGSALSLVRDAEEEARESAERLAAAQRQKRQPSATALPDGTAQVIREAIARGECKGPVTDTGDIEHLAETVIRMGVRTMSGSVYEFEPNMRRVRFVSGPHGPTPNMSPAGSWHEYLACSMPTIGTRIRMMWPGERLTTLTPVAATWAVGIIDTTADLPECLPTSTEADTDR